MGLFIQAWLIYQTPPSFQSMSKMMLAGKMNIAQSAVYSEDSVNFYGTQIQLMQSAEVRRSAEALVRSTHPEMQPIQVEITVAQKPRTSIFDLIAIGSTPLIARNRVDFPAPLTPSSATISPSRTSKSQPYSVCTLP